jgi:hypothetical protein
MERFLRRLGSAWQTRFDWPRPLGSTRPFDYRHKERRSNPGWIYLLLESILLWSGPRRRGWIWHAARQRSLGSADADIAGVVRAEDVGGPPIAAGDEKARHALAAQLAGLPGREREALNILGDLIGGSDLGVVGDAWDQLGGVYAQQPGHERMADLAFTNAAHVKAKARSGHRDRERADS